MSDGPAVIYRYDGSYTGFLCCVAESERRGEEPAGFCLNDEAQATLFDIRDIASSPKLSAALLRRMVTAMGGEAVNTVKRAFLTWCEG